MGSMMFACSFPGCVEYLPSVGICSKHKENDNPPEWSVHHRTVEPVRTNRRRQERIERTKLAKQLFKDGNTAEHISEILGVGKRYVHEYLRDTSV